VNAEATEPTGITRRRLLGSAAAVGGLAAASLALPPNVRKARASPPPTDGRLDDIKHVVLLMQENRSFDHYFRTLSGVRGFDDPDALRLPGGKPVFFQPDPANPDGHLLPYRLNTRISAAQAIPSMSHAWEVQHAAWHGGAMDNWVPAHLQADGSDGRTRWGTSSARTSRSSTRSRTRSPSTPTTARCSGRPGRPGRPGRTATCGWPAPSTRTASSAGRRSRRVRPPASTPGRPIRNAWSTPA
jgi:hypothetical protein